MPHLWLMQYLLWALSLMFGSLGVFVLYFILTGRLSLALTAFAVALLASAGAIVCSLPNLKDRGDRRG
jgi:1,4-dihydroxy-2-naphthoate octaprenyltransferase